MENKILEINNLKVIPNNDSKLKLVDDITLNLNKGKTTCIVGESGSGKSLTALSVMQLLSSQLTMSGNIFFEGTNLLNLSKDEIRKKRGKDIAMIFQEPMTSLNPVLTIGYQIQEAIQVHQKISNIDLRNSASLVLLGVFCTAIATIIYFQILQTSGASFISIMKRVQCCLCVITIKRRIKYIFNSHRYTSETNDLHCGGCVFSRECD